MEIKQDALHVKFNKDSHALEVLANNLIVLLIYVVILFLEKANNVITVTELDAIDALLHLDGIVQQY